MPRSATRPQVGSLVWYFAASPPAAKAQVAMVVNTATPQGSEGVGGPGPILDLCLFTPAGTTAPALGVPFFYGSRPAAGANPWCTMMRVNEPASGQWPSNQTLEAPVAAAQTQPAQEDFGENGNGDDNDNGNDKPAPHTVSRTRTTTHTRTTHR
jgi:hypothetical protein